MSVGESNSDVVPSQSFSIVSFYFVKFILDIVRNSIELQSVKEAVPSSLEGKPLTYGWRWQAWNKWRIHPSGREKFLKENGRSPLIKY